VSLLSSSSAGPQLVKNFPTLLGTLRFVIAFMKVCHRSLSWTISIQSMPPDPTSWISRLILSPFLCLDLLNGLFQLRLAADTLYVPMQFPTCATCPAHLILLDLISWITFCEQYRSQNCYLRNIIPSPVTSSLLGQHVFRNTQLSNALSQWSSRSTKFHSHTNNR